MRVLVTGANGLVGQRLCCQLLALGYSVIGVGRSDSSRCNIVSEQYEYVKLDLASEQAVVLLGGGIFGSLDWVIHCAAQQPCAELGYQDYELNNVRATLNLIEHFGRSVTCGFVAFSTVAFLDFPFEDNVPVDEKSPVKPSSYYQLSKYAAECVLRIESEKLDIPVYCLRIPSLVHEDQKGGFIDTIYQHGISGLNLELYDFGRYRRSLIYVDAICEYLELLFKFSSPTKGFNLLNIGSKDNWSMLNIAEYIYSKVSMGGDIIGVGKPTPVAGHWSMDVTKAEAYVDYKSWGTQKILDCYLLKKGKVKQ